MLQPASGRPREIFGCCGWPQHRVQWWAEVFTVPDMVIQVKEVRLWGPAWSQRTPACPLHNFNDPPPPPGAPLAQPTKGMGREGMV